MTAKKTIPTEEIEMTEREAQMLERKIWLNIDIRIHQEFLPKVNSILRSHIFATMLFPFVIWGLWFYKEPAFPIAMNIILTVVFSLSYIGITHSVFKFISMTLHHVAKMALYEETEAVEEAFEPKEKKRETTTKQK